MRSSISTDSGSAVTARSATGILVARSLLFVSLLVLACPAESIRAADYAFPIAGDRGVLWWEEEHWDGNLAVDIGIHPGFAPGTPERLEFYERDVVAVISGEASRLDNPRGGIAVLLHGDDNRTYYYAHLSESTINEPRRVSRGEPLGQIGRTGTWTQYLDPHLHFAIAAGHQHGFHWVADINPVTWIERTFGLAPARTTTQAYPLAEPSGTPLFGEYETRESFVETEAGNPLLAGTTVAPRRPGRVAVRAPLTGIVRIHVDTPLGTRVQITNARAAWSVIISGAIDPIIRHGELVYRESIVGFTEGPLHYMTFHRGRPVDPAR